MTTSVKPGENGASREFFELYCKAMGELDKLAELASYNEIFPHVDEIYSPDRQRMEYFFHGLLGLLDQSWRVEDPLFWRDYEQSTSLMSRLIAYGRECLREHGGLSKVRYTAHDPEAPKKQREDQP